MATDDHDTIRREFGEAVTMTAGELETWLDTDESRSVGQTSRWRCSLMNWGHDPLKDR
jgi:hypothetical protein